MLLSTIGLALATLLAAAAPLVHVHLDAASDTAAGLCGDHTGEGAGLPEAGRCPICLAAGHGHAAPTRALAPLRLHALSKRIAAREIPLPRAAPELHSGAPRAPPHLA